MENIKFRGKRIDNGEFIYGSYVFTYNCCYIIANEFISIPDEDATEYFIQVEPKTVSQFTGQKDINRIDIYEGDILHYEGITSFGKQIKEVVSYSTERAQFMSGIDPMSMYTVTPKIIGNAYTSISTTEA